VQNKKKEDKKIIKEKKTFIYQNISVEQVYNISTSLKEYYQRFKNKIHNNSLDNKLELEN
jgi:hypothetical protein